MIWISRIQHSLTQLNVLVYSNMDLSLVLSSMPELMLWLMVHLLMVLMLVTQLSLNLFTSDKIVVSPVFQNSNVLQSEVVVGMRPHMIVILVSHSVTRRLLLSQNPFSRLLMPQKISAQHQETVIATFSKFHNCILKEKPVIMVLICISMMVLQ